MSDDRCRDRAVGCLLGLAVGDAVGASLEFSPRDAHPPLEDMIGGGPFALEAGQWTDDTSMALCLADSLIAKGGEFDADDLMKRFLRWYSQGENSSTGRCFDIGNATRLALVEYQRTGRDASKFQADDRQAGNGSIMRLAPTVLVHASDRARAADLAEAQSRTTHRAEVTHAACRLLAEILHDAIGGAAKGEVFRSRAFDGTLKGVAAGEWQKKSRDEISSSGYVVATLEAALWCAERTESFREAVLLAANLADDADTVAAVTGQISGAIYGASGIPTSWLDTLAQRGRIERIANLLVNLSAA